MRGFALSLVLAVAVPAIAHAGEHVGPKSFFADKAPDEVLRQIEAACVARGFAARRAPDSDDVVCNGGDLVRSEVSFRPGSPPGDPKDTPQVYHRFSARAVDGGTLVSERSVGVLFLNRRLEELTPRLVMAKVINLRVAEFYRALGGVEAP